MTKFDTSGLYELLLTEEINRRLEALEGVLLERHEPASESAADYLARHLHELGLKVFRSFKGADALERQVQLANSVIALLSQDSEAGVDDGDRVRDPAGILLSLFRRAEQRLGDAQIERPSLPLRQSDLLVNGPRDQRLGHELNRELASADRVDLLVSFLKWSGLRVIKNQLDEFLGRRPGQLRVLTTTYLGATETRALDWLQERRVDVRVSYDTRRTRLHAKAWLFHRDSGFSTGFVGSSNLSHGALLDGCEWNVRLSLVDNRSILRKFQTTFDQYWSDGEFEPYDREAFLEATKKNSEALDHLAQTSGLRPYPHQEEVLQALEHEREHGHTRNLVVAATGTGKTAIAAFDYARYRKRHPEATLLFVAHRHEILKQSQATFRNALRNGNFGELQARGEEPVRGRHVFASIQSLRPRRLDELQPRAYDFIVVDEFHHAAATTYRRLLEHLEPSILLGLTATPERADGQSILHWFNNRIAAETRLWDALDLGLLVPFQYFGVYDGTDLSLVNWRSGRYDTEGLENVYTADDVRARAVIRAVREHVRSPRDMRALGFCVSVKHAQYMADFFEGEGIAAVAVHGRTPTAEREAVRQRLATKEVNIVFTVDLFNEGVDLPFVDTVLMLRPTESATIFLQQLGRGLRLAEGKDCLTVLDFIGKARREFRFDLRYKALTGGTRASVRRAVEEGFPNLPAGTELLLDRETQEVVLANLRNVVGGRTQELVADLVAMGDVSLADFLQGIDSQPEDLYTGGRTFTLLRQHADHTTSPPPEPNTARAFARLLHVDDDERINTWSSWLAGPKPPPANPDDPLQLMLFALLGNVRRPVIELGLALQEFWSHDDLRNELHQLLQMLADRARRPTHGLDRLPFRIHGTYSRDEISAGLLQTRKGKLLRTQSGVYKDNASRCDVLYVTLEKNASEFTPTTLYEDYPISDTRFHWESQGVTRADSDTGQRYQNHEAMDWRILLFVRRAKKTRSLTQPYLFLGPTRYVEHEDEKPMRIIWELDVPMPPGFYREAKIAAG